MKLTKSIDAVQVGETVTGLYPKNGNRNILRRFIGKVLEKASAKNGLYIKVQESSDGQKIRSFLANKISTGKVEVA